MTQLWNTTAAISVTEGREFYTTFMNTQIYKLIFCTSFRRCSQLNYLTGVSQYISQKRCQLLTCLLKFLVLALRWEKVHQYFFSFPVFHSSMSTFVSRNISGYTTSWHLRVYLYECFSSDQKAKWIFRLSPCTVFDFTSKNMIFKNVTWIPFRRNYAWRCASEVHCNC